MKNFIVAISVLFSFNVMAQQPMKVGQCIKTKVSEISSRLEGDAGSGSRIRFKNEAEIVSYAIEPEIENSKIGDVVKVCRQKLDPSFDGACPTGVPKGYALYSVYNFRTKESFSGANSSHSC